MTIEPIAYFHSPLMSKFGIPRQSGLAATLPGRIVFTPDYRREEAVRGLEGFDYLWLIWEFSSSGAVGALTVRPPRLGGNERVGVFASRSPYRPNSLGLSCVKLLRVDYNDALAPVLYVSGADLVDGTPIYDVKPYLPFADAVPGAVGGFADGVAGQRLRVKYAADPAGLPEALLLQLTEVLAGDPRPHYQNDPERVYAFEFAGYHVEFTCAADLLTVTNLTKI